MENLYKYFSENFPLKIDNKKNSNEMNDFTINIDNNKKIILDYLNYKEILNPLNTTFDDCLCYFYLLEIYFIIKFNSSKSEVIRRINKLSNIKFINDKSEEEKVEEGRRRSRNRR